MKKLKILLTGDDGVEALGTRVLARGLKDDHDLFIVGTKEQQSGIGGKLSIGKTMAWDELEVESVPAIWVDGTPCDAMEFAQAHFSEKFDLIISGINWGENVTYGSISSGTFSAAVRGIGDRLADKAIVLSWKTKDFIKDWFKKHDSGDGIKEFMKYPGKAAIDLVDDLIENDMHGAMIANINLPYEQTDEVRYTRVGRDATKYWRYPWKIDYKKKILHYPYTEVHSDTPEDDENIDSGAINAGYISVSLIKRMYEEMEK